MGRGAPKTERRLDRQYIRALKPWTDDELNVLGEKYGLVRDSTLARMLQRSPSAIHIVAVRKLHISHSTNFFTARGVAESLGIADSKTIIYWMKQGWILGTKSVVRAGKYARWRFLDQDIENCVKRRPWLCDVAKMPPGYRCLVIDEYQRDPWYKDCHDVAGLLGIKDINAVHRYIRKGWLHADRKPGGPHQGRYLVRRSDVEAFLAADPRPTRAESMSKNMLGRHRRVGRPQRLSMRWLVSCPKCGHDVLVTAPPCKWGPEVIRLLAEEYSQGETCTHGYRVVVGWKQDENSTR